MAGGDSTWRDLKGQGNRDGAVVEWRGRQLDARIAIGNDRIDTAITLAIGMGAMGPGLCAVAAVVSVVHCPSRGGHRDRAGAGNPCQGHGNGQQRRDDGLPTFHATTYTLFAWHRSTGPLTQ